MKKIKRFLAMLLAILTIVSVFSVTQLTASATASNGVWKKDIVGDWNYYVNGNKIRNDWVYDGGSWYYVDQYGDMLHNEWFHDGTGWYYLSSSGRMLANQWFEEKAGAGRYDIGGNYTRDSEWYYLSSSGRMLANQWFHDGNGWTYLGYSGAMYKNRWFKSDNIWYQLGSNGYICKQTNKKPSTELSKVKNLDCDVTVTKATVDYTKYAYDKLGVLTWSKVSNATQYEISVNYNNERKETVYVSKNSYNLHHAITGFGSNLNTYPLYTVKVRAIMFTGDKIYKGPWSSTKTIWM